MGQKGHQEGHQEGQKEQRMVVVPRQRQWLVQKQQLVHEQQLVQEQQQVQEQQRCKEVPQVWDPGVPRVVGGSQPVEMS